MERKQTALLIIDAQNDFSHPDGALYIPGADEDMSRLAAFIGRNTGKIDHITATIDTHGIHDISHPGFWEDASGNKPSPFTQVSYQDIQNGKWQAVFRKEESHEYVRKLEEQGEYPHFIWPEHCLDGSWGAALHSTVHEALSEWSRKRKRDYHIVRKGLYPYTEMFGVFQAQIPDERVPATQLNTEFLALLNEYDRVLVAGEAKSHCVATSVKQILQNAHDLVPKLIILENCMSDVTDMGHLGEPVYQEAKESGVPFINSEAEFH